MHQELALKIQLLQKENIQLHTYTINYTFNLENNYVKLYWDRTLLTDQTVTHNGADHAKRSSHSQNHQLGCKAYHRNSANHYLIHLNNSKESAEVHQRIRTR